ncbi:hypothetical protein QQF64_027236 [Cirrhinus molitorella]|uniref:N-acetyltransferase domain-containing protein n=1 Tax=Cirrhinus molitorella TaxID=172907 RepID=A0ABR3NCE6_9TELE
MGRGEKGEKGAQGVMWPLMGPGVRTKPLRPPPLPLKKKFLIKSTRFTWVTCFGFKTANFAERKRDMNILDEKGELAVYEKMPDQVKISHKELERDGFGRNPFYQCLVAEVSEDHKSKDGHTKVGYSLFFYTYSTWKGRTVYMEDLYVMPEYRGKGIGKALMATVAKVAKEQHCVRLQFSVLDWNKPSLDFYLAKGAEDLTAKEGWHFLRFHGIALDNLAREAP